MIQEIKIHIDSLNKQELLNMYGACEQECNLLRELKQTKLLEERVKELQYICSRL